MRSAPLALAVAILAAAPLAARAQGEPVTVEEVPAEEGVVAVRATARLPAAPSEVYETATRFESWDEALPDVRDLKVRRTEEGATIRYYSSILRARTTSEYRLLPGEGFDFTMKGSGVGPTRGQMRLSPAPGGGTVAVLTVRVQRAGLGKVAPERLIRARATEKVRSDLEAMADALGGASASGSGEGATGQGGSGEARRR